MEGSYLMIIILLALKTSSIVLLSYFCFRISYSIWWKPKWLEKQLQHQGIRGNPYKPFIGDMLDYTKQISEAWSKPMSLSHQIVPRVDPFTHNTVQKYGKISLNWAGTTPRINIMDPELIKEVLANKQHHLGVTPLVLNPYILVLSEGLTILEGETWAKHRKIMSPVLNLEKLKGMISVYAESSSLLVEKWKKALAVEGTCEINVWPEFLDLTGDIISRTVFGSSFEEGKRVINLQKELQKLVLEAIQYSYIPGFRFIPTRTNRRLKSLDRNINSVLHTLIERKETAMRTGIADGEDLLGNFLKSNYAYYEQPSESSTHETGYETTSSLLTWTMVALAMHPTWQDEAREEVVRVCGQSHPNAKTVAQLQTVTMILHEVLRLYPPAVSVFRHTYHETNIGDLVVPAGVDIHIPLLFTNHDQEIWGNDAEEFKPERFSQGLSKASLVQSAFSPFGFGPKTCIGQNFALMEAKVALALILQKFSFELSSSYTHAPNTAITLQPQHGALFIVKKTGST